MSVVGFAPEEIRTGESTRSARLKWVVIVDETLAAGRAVNAAICVAAATAQKVQGLLGPDGKDAAGSAHSGLPWAGCSILAAPSATLNDIRARVATDSSVFVADMPAAAQETRIYDEYLDQLSAANPTDLTYLAVSLVGPKNRIDKITKGLRLMP